MPSASRDDDEPSSTTGVIRERVLAIADLLDGQLGRMADRIHELGEADLLERVIEHEVSIMRVSGAHVDATPGEERDRRVFETMDDPKRH